MSQVFSKITTSIIAEIIAQAKEEVILVIPGITHEISQELVKLAQNIGWENITLILDCESETIRLGYGRFDPIKEVLNAGCEVRNSPNVRIGVLLVDNKGWIFSPTATYIEDEPLQVLVPNSVEIAPAEIMRIRKALIPDISSQKGKQCLPAEEVQINKITSNDDSQGVGEDWGTKSEAVILPVEIGRKYLSDEILDLTDDDLKQNPPIEPEDARRTRILNYKIRLIKATFKGFKFNQRKIKLESKYLGISTKEIQDHIGAQWALFNDNIYEKNLKEIIEPLNDKWRTILNSFTVNLKDYGRVILMHNLSEFNTAVKTFETKDIPDSREKLIHSLETSLEQSKKQLKEFLFEKIDKEPPEQLRKILLLDSNRRNQIIDIVNEIIHESKFPSAKVLIDDVQVKVIESNVSETMLNDPEFQELISNKMKLAVDQVAHFEDLFGKKESVIQK